MATQRYGVPRGVYAPVEVDEKAEKGQRRAFGSLWWWHCLAFMAHSVTALVIFGWALYQELAEKAAGKRLRGAVYSDVLEVETGQVSYSKFGDGYDLLWVLFFVPGLTALVHLYQAYRCGQTRQSPYKINVMRGMNKTRWSEYSVTAALMTWILCQLCGITNLYVLLAVALFGNLVLQWHGYYFEEALATPSASRFDLAVPMLRGFLIFFFQWVVITAAFVRTASASSTELPWFVWVSFFGIFGTYMTFPVLQLMYASKRVVKNWYQYERGFILLSIVSKMLLTLTLFSAAVDME